MLSRLVCLLCISLLWLGGCDDTGPTSTENNCQASPCLNGGTCSVDGETVNCECVDGFSGDLCEVADTQPCEPDPCENGGECSVGDDGNAVCACTEGYSGDRCEVAPVEDPCDPNPCQNEGSCAASDTGEPTCTCTDGYEGDLCETAIDPCEPNPCLNEGTCEANDDGSTACTCADGFEGDLCENEKVPTPCEFHCEGIVAAGCDNPALPNEGACVVLCEQLTADPGCGPLFEAVVGCMDDSNAWTCMPSDPADPESETSFVPAKEECVQPFIGWYQCTQMADVCNTFCETAEATCTDDNAMNFGDAGCFNTCVGWAPGTEGDTEGDSLACRAYHLAVAGQDAPDVHCPHAGPDGGGVCDPPTWCELTCAETTKCDEEADVEGCLTLCDEAINGPCADEVAALQACPESTGEWMCDENGDAMPASDACQAEMEAIDTCYAALDPCYGEPCANGGECTSNEDDTFTCACAEGFLGDTCEEVNPCIPNPCENDGSCSIEEDGSAQCDCMEGYEGATCSDQNYCIVTCLAQDEACGGNDAADCTGNCLLNEQGPCSAETLALQECQPAEDWICNENGMAVPEGDACSNEWTAILECLDPCLPNVCDEGTVCVPEADGSSTCVATSCDPNPCQNDADCWEFGEEGDAVTCFCDAGFFGPLCENEVTPCAPDNPCENKATCSVTADGEDFICECPDGFVGKTCNNTEGGACDPSPCGNGSCAEIDTFCQGAACEEATCKAAVCVLDSFCCNSWDNGCASCAAGEVTAWADCTGIVGCGLEETTAVCSCDEGWEGKSCDVDVDECAGDFTPCQNDSVCMNNDGGYNCGCVEGWEGDNCGINVDDCPEENPCQNDGTCVDGLNEYTCDCVEGTAGEFCEENVNECLEDVCGDGTCVDELPGYSCECPEGYLGDACEITPPCEGEPCQNGGLCTNTGDIPTEPGFVCQDGSADCDNPTCQAEVGTADDWCLSNWDNSCAACAKGEVTNFADCTTIDTDVCYDAGATGYACECVEDYVGEMCESCGTCGDINGDGAITQEDTEAVAGLVGNELSICKAWIADVNGDGEVNVVDAQVLTAYLNGDDMELTCTE